MNFVNRLGLAIVAPRRAFAIAGDRRVAGRSGSDLIGLILLVMIATQLRWLYKAAWLGGAVDLSVGLRAAMHVVTRTLAIDLGFLVIGTLVIYAGTGQRREVGHAFDLGCVAVIPLVLVDLVATTALHVLDLPVASPVMWIASGLSYGWCGTLVLLALVRRGAEGSPQRATLLGRIVLAIVLVGTAFEGLWIAGHLELLRPMRGGESAPPFTLARIGADGQVGAPLALDSLRGKVVVLDFWETWCGPCLAAMPGLDALARKHPEVQVLAINMDDKAKARALFTARGFSLELLADDFDTSERYGVTTIPHTVVIDRAGVVRHVFRGGGGSKLDAAVEALLAAPPT
ncbi:MAG: TlpA disulfide reductase family protein [Proteobacteria bacterium]|nr:TlpA disulfide reductase family protein [Pseudomonadota bacterium]